MGLLTTKSYGKDIFLPLLNELVRLEPIQNLAECEAPRATPKHGARAENRNQILEFQYSKAKANNRKLMTGAEQHNPVSNLTEYNIYL